MLKSEVLHAGGMANIIEQRVEKWDGQVLVCIVNFEMCLRRGLSPPKEPSREEAIKHGLNKRRTKIPVALLFRDIEYKS